MTAIMLAAPVPVLRVSDLALARGFYGGFLGCAWDWERRVAPRLPRQAQVSRGALVLQLAEYQGEAMPGAMLRISVAGLDALQAELALKPYPRARPAIQPEPSGGRVLGIVDPFGNRLVFCDAGASG